MERGSGSRGWREKRRQCGSERRGEWSGGVASLRGRSVSSRWAGSSIDRELWRRHGVWEGDWLDGRHRGRGNRREGGDGRRGERKVCARLRERRGKAVGGIVPTWGDRGFVETFDVLVGTVAVKVLSCGDEDNLLLRDFFQGKHLNPWVREKTEDCVFIRRQAKARGDDEQELCEVVDSDGDMAAGLAPSSHTTHHHLQLVPHILAKSEPLYSSSIVFLQSLSFSLSLFSSSPSLSLLSVGRLSFLCCVRQSFR
jgi:hypothetical protein